MALSDLNNKVENGGVTPRGKLSAAEWNELIDAILAFQTASNNAITTLVNRKANAADVYTKDNTYTKDEINSLITQNTQSVVIVDELPPTGNPNTLYRVPGDNSYSDYGWNGTQFVLLATYSGDGTELAAVKVRVTKLENDVKDLVVPEWAQQASKPSYTLDEIPDGTNRRLSNFVSKTLKINGHALTEDITLTAADLGITAQNAFNAIKVGNLTINADTGKNTLELVAGSNVTLTPDTTNNKLSVAVSVPTKISELENDEGFLTALDVPEGAAASTTTPLMDGTASVGTQLAFARGDHRHPSDTTKADLANTITDVSYDAVNKRLMVGKAGAASQSLITTQKIVDDGGAFLKTGGVISGLVTMQDGLELSFKEKVAGTEYYTIKDIIFSSGNMEMLGGDITTRNVTAAKFVKKNGTANEFLKADGSVDSTAYIPMSSIGAAGGVCPLGANSKINLQYMPSIVGNMVEAYIRPNQTPLSATWLAKDSETGAALTPERGVVYVLMNSSGDYEINTMFRWNGTEYAMLSAGNASGAENAIENITFNGNLVPINEQKVAVITAAIPSMLGDMGNVTDVIDTESDILLYREANSDEWKTMPISNLIGYLEPVSTALRVTDQMGSTELSFYKTSTTANVQVMVTSRQKDNQAGTDWQDTGEKVSLTVEKRQSDGTWTAVLTRPNEQSGTVLTLDLRSILDVGDNLIRISADGLSTGETSPYLVYTVKIVVVYPTISIEALEWGLPQTGDLKIPLNYTGDMSKTLHINILGDNDYSYTKTEFLGTETRSSIPREFTIQAPTESGVYTVMAWITTDDPDVSSETVGRNILWLADGAVGKWLLVNSIASQLTNWTDNNVMQYVLYDTSSTVSSITFSVKQGVEEVYHSALVGVERSKQTLVVPLEIESGITSFDVTLDAADGSDSYGTWTIPVDNSVNYAATSGAVFRLSPKTRTNSDANKDKIVNVITGEEITTRTTNMTYSSADMWTTDANGERCLQINSGQRVWFDLNPMASNVAQGSGVTIEFDYKIDNVSDYSALGIDISRPFNDSFIGLQVGASRMLLKTQATQSDSEQELIIDDGVRMTIAFTVVPRAYTFQDTTGATRYMNLVRYYINGRINRCFEIQDTDVLTCSTGITLGSDDCDLTLYGMTVYAEKLDFASEHQNYINMLPTVAEKAAEKSFNDIYDNGELSFDKIRAILNCFVTDKPFPSLKEDVDYDLGGSTDRKDVTMELYVLTAIYNYIKTHPTRQGGQGTSSMRYWEWNQRLRILKNTTITYGVNGEVIDTQTHVVNLWEFLPPVADLTMKKNWASSMQDHKAGSVNTLTDVWKAMGLSNEAVDADSKVRISVYQEPFVGWYKKERADGTFKYVCMGNFTGGPHKGDKKCFGYDLKKFPATLSMEGCNNDPVLTQFKMPWDDEHVYVDTSDDILVMYRTGYDASGNAQWTKAWEQDFGSVEAGDSNAVATEKLASFIAAYNDIYQFNPYVAPWEGTVAQLNAAAAEWKAALQAGTMSQAEYQTKIGTEYWLANSGSDQYDLYTYDPSTGTFYLSTVNGVKQNVEQYL